MQEAWSRYHLPMAITEAQLACTREEQVRWICEMWEASHVARNAGVDVRAVTAWALFGAYDWDSLLLRERRRYENGAFTLQGGVPRETAVAAAIRGLATQGSFDHPLLKTPGWWRRPERILFGPVSAPRTGPGNAITQLEPGNEDEPKLLVIVTRSDLLREICALRSLRCGLVGPAEAKSEVVLSGQSWWAVLMEQSAPPEIEELCQAHGIPCARLPARYNRRAIRRTLDRLIDASCVAMPALTR
jgi:hypothetical protein